MNLSRYLKALGCAHGFHKFSSMISDATKTEGNKVYGGHICVNCDEMVWMLWIDYQVEINARAERGRVAELRDRIRRTYVKTP